MPDAAAAEAKPHGQAKCRWCVRQVGKSGPRGLSRRRRRRRTPERRRLRPGKLRGGGDETACHPDSQEASGWSLRPRRQVAATWWRPIRCSWQTASGRRLSGESRRRQTGLPCVCAEALTRPETPSAGWPWHRQPSCRSETGRLRTPQRTQGRSRRSGSRRRPRRKRPRPPPCGSRCPSCTTILMPTTNNMASNTIA